jgi:protoporphyrinogen oxidase
MPPPALLNKALLDARAPALHPGKLRSQTGILGGGLSGLTVAAHLEDDCEVLEADPFPGGHCGSVIEQGFTFDAGGPHIIFSRNAKTLDFMLSLLGRNISRGRRNNKIFYNGRYVKYPFENGLFDLAPQDRFECLRDYVSNAHPPPANFRQWMFHTFGTAITEKYLLPYNEKIWKVPAEQMSLDWVEGRIPRPPLEDVIKAAVGVETEGYQHQLFFYYPTRGGIQSLPDAMARRVPRLTTNFRVHNVRRTGDAWAVTDGEREYRYRHLVSTLPINEMAHKFEGVPDDIKRCGDSLRFNSLVTITIGLASERLPDYSAIYVPSPELPFHRVSFPAIFSPQNVPAGKSLIQAEITCMPSHGIWGADDSEILNRVVDGLRAMELVRPEEICYAKVIRTKYGYVVQDFTYREHLQKLKSYFEQQGITLCGRNAQFEYINMDQCIEGAQKVAARLNAAACSTVAEQLCPQ